MTILYVAAAFAFGFAVAWGFAGATIRGYRDRYEDQLADSEATVFVMRENAAVNVELAAVANYKSGLRDGVTGTVDRILGRYPEGEEGVGSTYRGAVPGPLKRWLEDLKARAEEHAL